MSPLGRHKPSGLASGGAGAKPGGRRRRDLDRGLCPAVRRSGRGVLPRPAGRDDARSVAALAFRLLPHVTRWPELIAEMGRLARQAVIVDYPTTRSVNAASGTFFSLKRG